MQAGGRGAGRGRPPPHPLRRECRYSRHHGRKREEEQLQQSESATRPGRGSKRDHYRTDVTVLDLVNSWPTRDRLPRTRWSAVVHDSSTGSQRRSRDGRAAARAAPESYGDSWCWPRNGREGLGPERPLVVEAGSGDGVPGGRATSRARRAEQAAEREREQAAHLVSHGAGGMAILAESCATWPIAHAGALWGAGLTSPGGARGVCPKAGAYHGLPRALSGEHRLQARGHHRDSQGGRALPWTMRVRGPKGRGGVWGPAGRALLVRAGRKRWRRRAKSEFMANMTTRSAPPQRLSG